MLLILVAVSAFVPSILLVWYFRSRDVNPEPGSFLWATFGLGVATVIPVLIVALPTGMLFEPFVKDPYVLGLMNAFLTAAIPEELFKLSVLVFYCYRHKDFDEPMDGIVLGAVASLGFATLENVLYVMKGGLGTAVLRALTAVPSHAFLGAIMGYFVGQAKLYPARKWKLIASGFGFAVLFHGAYDFPLLALSNFNKLKIDGPPVGDMLQLVLAPIIVLVVETIWAVRLTRRLRKEQLDAAVVKVVAASAIVEAGGDAGVSVPPGASIPVSASMPRGASMPPIIPMPMPVPRSSGIVPMSAPAPAPASGSSFVAWLGVIFGGILASAGGLVMLTVIGAVIFSPPDAPDTRPMIIGGVAIGVLPLVVGLALFGLGISKMRAARPPVQRGAPWSQPGAYRPAA